MTYAMISLEDYATFETIDQMDAEVQHFNRQLNSAHYETLNLLKQYSLKIVGVSHLKVETIATQLEKSISTIKRHIKYLKDNGFITVVNTRRQKQGGKGANAYVINTVNYRRKWLKNKNEPSQMSHRNGLKTDGSTQSARAFAYVKAKKETIDSLNYSKSLKSNTEGNQAHTNVRVCPNGVPSHIHSAMRPFFSDREIQTIYLNTKKRMESFFKTILSLEDIDETIEIAIRSLLNAKRDFKTNQRHQDIFNPVAYVASAAWHMAVDVQLGNDLYDYSAPLSHSGYRTLFS